MSVRKIASVQTRKDMSSNNTLCFATFDPPNDVPSVCGVCTSSTPIFRYTFSADDKNAEYMKGFCCAFCAAKLLEVLKHVEAKPWGRAQDALKTHDLDVTELQ